MIASKDGGGQRRMIQVQGHSGDVEFPPPPPSDIDYALTMQLAVAWAGETGGARLSWWRSELVSEFGGEDLFRRLLPTTWQWATFEAAREAAIRTEMALRRLDPESDRIVSLYCFGTATDERINHN